MKNKQTIIHKTSQHEKTQQASFTDLFLNFHDIMPHDELLRNLGLFLSRQTMSRLLFIHELYKLSLNVHGIIAEFGVRWGQNLALFETFRGIYEPYNHNRKIIGFDTFEGFASIHEKDGTHSIIQNGAFSVTKKYENTLEEILDYHESQSPISHIRKFELIKGDATTTVKKYLDENPQTIISLAYFDFDIYQPTYECLRLIKNHITKGTVIAFDELNYAETPGETIALKEAFGLDKYAIRRVPYSPTTSYLIVE